MHAAEYDMPLSGLDWLQPYAPHNVFHPGIDYNKGRGNDDLGNPCWSMTEAVVDYVAPLNQANGGFGNFVILKFPAYGLYARYAHLDTVAVKVGQQLGEGDLIGKVGKTGTTYAHLHLEIFKQSFYDKYRNTGNGPFRFYPSGKSRAWVQEHFISPWDFVAMIEKDKVPEEHWSDEAMEFLMEARIITKEKDPQTPISWGEYAVVIERTIEYIKNNS